MANQIADFFAAYPDDEAAAMVADHIMKFWAPPMRQDLAAMLAAGRGDDLSPLARRAAERVVAAASGAA